MKGVVSISYILRVRVTHMGHFAETLKYEQQHVRYFRTSVADVSAGQSFACRVCLFSTDWSSDQTDLTSLHVCPVCLAFSMEKMPAVEALTSATNVQKFRTCLRKLRPQIFMTSWWFEKSPEKSSGRNKNLFFSCKTLCCVSIRFSGPWSRDISARVCRGGIQSDREQPDRT